MSRIIKSSNDFFDILDGLKNNDFVTIGYVTGANLDVPKIKNKNPATNRMKSYPDYTTFKKEGYDNEIGALVKITTYNFRYYNRKTVGQKYGEYKNSVNQIRSEFGIDPVQDRESYKSATGWSDKAPEVYAGKREDLASHSYNPQNMYGANTNSVVYAVDTEGHIVRELDLEEVKPYLKAKREPDGVAALRKMGADEERIKQFIDRIKELKFSYKNFESNSILWMCATVNGEKIIYINDNMNRVVDEINIRPEDFRKIARERYQLSLDMFTENRKRNVVRLTESQLKQIITESVKRVLKESVNEFEFGEHEDLGRGRHRQVILFNGKEIGFLLTIETSPLAPLKEVYVIPDVDEGMSEPTDSLRDGAKGWIEFKRFTNYDEALKYATDNFEDISYLFEFGDWD